MHRSGDYRSRRIWDVPDAVVVGSENQPASGIWLVGCILDIPPSFNRADQFTACIHHCWGTFKCTVPAIIGAGAFGIYPMRARLSLVGCILDAPPPFKSRSIYGVHQPLVRHIQMHRFGDYRSRRIWDLPPHGYGAFGRLLALGKREWRIENAPYGDRSGPNGAPHCKEASNTCRDVISKRCTPTLQGASLAKLSPLSRPGRLLFLYGEPSCPPWRQFADGSDPAAAHRCQSGPT